MVKTKYQTLSREEKRKAKDEYFKTVQGKELKLRLNRLMIYGIILILFGIYLIVDGIINGITTLQVLYATGIIIVACIFIIGRHYALIKQVNSHIVGKKNKKK